MRITHFETFLCSYPFPEDKSWWGGQSWQMDLKGVRFNAIILRVHTDEGITGLGEPSGWGDCRAIEATLRRLEQRFAGKDPFDVEKLTVHTPDRTVNSALAAIDCALWDIIGKATATPVYRLLAKDGDYQSEHIRTYASGGVSYNWFSKRDQIFDEIAQLKAEGFTAFKMRIGSAWGLGGVTVGTFGDHLTRVRAALGDDIDLMLDAICRFRSVQEAVEVAHILEGLKARWFEEPIPRPTDDNDDRYNQIRNSTRVPISGGEGLNPLAEYQRAYRVKAYEIV